ncbi:unnamed protein product [Echinostoma caproni]|uniref:Uncharacterized protein n=1 Tax=Echinostoma caproni TaxID=27848 RepID=A0A183A797_9TREM|nr:unnamed protein product [Echinostoma caproni]
MRLLISDGSGCALVELSRPLSMATTASPVLNDTNQSDWGKLELVRTLLGLDPANWRRLCRALEGELYAQRHKHPVGVLSVPLKTDERSPHFSPLQFALRAFLTSPAFLRPHIFTLERIVTGAAWKSTGNLWRLRQTRLQRNTDENSADESGLLVRFAVPPLQLFHLIELSSDF